MKTIPQYGHVLSFSLLALLCFFMCLMKSLFANCPWNSSLQIWHILILDIWCVRACLDMVWNPQSPGQLKAEIKASVFPSINILDTNLSSIIKNFFPLFASPNIYIVATSGSKGFTLVQWVNTVSSLSLITPALFMSYKSTSVFELDSAIWTCSSLDLIRLFVIILMLFIFSPTILAMEFFLTNWTYSDLW